MSNAHKPIVLYETIPEKCPYLEDRQSTSILVNPKHKIDQGIFSQLSLLGFRRSGEMLYAPQCPSCQACISVRIPVQKFTISRSQKRVWKRNPDLNVELQEVEFSKEHFDLYTSYQRARHPDSSMCNDNPQTYLDFLQSSYSNSQFLCFKEKNVLIGVSVFDQFHNGISAVYTYFSPMHAKRSLGTYAILYLLYIAELNRIPYLYLGYWIKNSKTMAYKKQFKPLEGYIDQQWKEFS